MTTIARLLWHTVYNVRTTRKPLYLNMFADTHNGYYPRTARDIDFMIVSNLRTGSQMHKRLLRYLIRGYK